MDGSGQLADRKRGAAPLWAGELIVQNGRQSGARRPLQVPLTFVGRAQGCDIRLNVDGLDPMHCLLVHGPSGLMIRDLDSTSGTFVNGERITNVHLKDGDLLTVGPFQFRLHLPPANFAHSERAATASEEPGGDRDALRLQAAAVAAQQVSLGEEEVRLLQRKASLERQEEQLASHLEEKRRKLLALNERAQSERHALQQDRAAYEKHLEKITGDLTVAQREVLHGREKLQAQRRRLAELYRRLRLRMNHLSRAHQEELKKGADLVAQERASLEVIGRRLDEREQDLLAQQLKFNGQYESGRQQLKLAWARLREAQTRWRQRRKQELAVLKQRRHETDAATQQLVLSERQLHEEKKTWEERRPALEKEIEGLAQRVKNQRHKILEHQLEINRLDNLLRLRPERQEESTALVPLPSPSIEADRKKGQASRQQGKGKKGRGKNEPISVPVEVISIVPAPGSDNPTWRQFEIEVQRRLAHLELLAGDLADQRLQILEQWQRLVHTQHTWEKDRAQSAADLESVALRLYQQEESLNQRERTYEQTDQQLRLRYRELVHLRQHLVGWRARLKTRENGLEGERQQLLADVQSREELVEKQLGSIVELRQRWARRRRQELVRFEADRAALQQMQKECLAQREELTRRTTQLEEEKRDLTEKTLALEQYRQDFFIRLNQPGTGERRLDRLRRRWLTQHALLVRATVQERETLQQELARLATILQEVQKRQVVVEKAEQELTDKQAVFEHKQALAAARNARLEQELQSSQSQRQLIEQQLGRMKEEIERIARQLLDDPEPPTTQLDRAA